jgi:predicted Zn-dependent protease
LLNTLRWLLSVLATAALLLAPVSPPVLAQGRPLQLIRDQEIESIIRVYATPLFQAAGLDPRAITVYLVQDSSLNAFVMGGQNLFINTGLLMRAEDPLEVIGVIAHETGHIAGGHIAQRIGAAQDATATMLVAQLLGILGAIASGRGEVAGAVISGAGDIALKGLLSFTRSQEQAADQAAITYLQRSGLSPKGLLTFMGRLRGQEVLLAANQDPYLTTHPLTRERLAYLEQQVAASAVRDQPAPAELVQLHARLRAKLIGYLEPRSVVMRHYPVGDQSLPARYAHALLEYREGHLDKALTLVDSLLAEQPNDPFFLEMKGQMLFESGHLQEALPVFEAAVTAMPHAQQIRLLLARTQIELNAPEYDRQAIKNLQLVLTAEPNNGFAWRFAAVAYGRLGDEGMAALALAESALARGKNDDALLYAERARDILPTGSPAWVQADDIALEAQRRIDKKN